VPTLCGPVYSGKLGMGLNREKQEVMMSVRVVRNENGIQGYFRELYL
jgi:hypothetical protein